MSSCKYSRTKRKIETFLFSTNNCLYFLPITSFFKDDKYASPLILLLFFLKIERKKTKMHGRMLVLKIRTLGLLTFLVLFSNTDVNKVLFN